jgi:hypothetical protein
MNVTRLVANDGMIVKEFKKDVVYSKSELSCDIYNVYKLRGDLTEIKTEKNVLTSVDDLHKSKRNRGVK